MNATKKTQRTDAERAAEHLEDVIYMERSGRKSFDAAITTILARLEGIADNVRRAQTRYSEQSAARTAEEIQHAILWGLANLGLDGLTREAAESDCSARIAADARKADEATATKSGEGK